MNGYARSIRLKLSAKSAMQHSAAITSTRHDVAMVAISAAVGSRVLVDLGIPWTPTVALSTRALLPRRLIDLKSACPLLQHTAPWRCGRLSDELCDGASQSQISRISR